MNSHDICFRTNKGNEEIQTRKHKLAPKLRTLLILVDDSKNAAALLQQAAQLGAPADALQQLEQQGFISSRAARSEPAIPDESADAPPDFIGF